jgi:FAD-NAD(P)-binding
MIFDRYTDIAIIGAGPHSLTLVTHLLQKKSNLRSKITVFDPSGTWLRQWQHQFIAQEIPHLRSPAVHHPHPNPFALRKFAESRPHELFPPFDLPGTKLFNDFCQNLIDQNQLQKMVLADVVTRIIPEKGSFQLLLESGDLIKARRVVVARGDSILSVPDWVKKIPRGYPTSTLVHSNQVDLTSLYLRNERILVIGGGLTSGHLALGAIARGAMVDLMTRGEFKEKLFDADAGWLGPKYLKGFYGETCWAKRVEMIKQARNGGSMTPVMMTKLRHLQKKGKLKLEKNCQVIDAQWKNNQWQVKCENGQIYNYDRIWLATGSVFNAEIHPLLGEIWEKYHTTLVKGLPILDNYLRVKGTELFIMGGLTALNLGPTARNLSGAIKASQLITEAIVKPSLAVI